jgi:outer membrane protein assembly factor BamB
MLTMKERSIMKTHGAYRCLPIALALAAAAFAIVAATWPAIPAAGAMESATTPGKEAQPSNDWPQWLGPNRNGISAETGWRTDWAANPPKELWRKKVGDGFTTVSVAAGHLYTTGNTAEADTVFCLNPETGAEIWKYTYPCENGPQPGTRCVPTVDGATLYTFSREGELFCLSADKGELRWKVNLMKTCGLAKPMWGFATQPLILGDRLFMTVGPTIALEKATGKVLWKSGDDKGGYSSGYAFQQGGKTLVAGMNDFGLRIVEAEGGKEVARFHWETARPVHPVTPIVSGDKIFISSGYDKGGALLKLVGNDLKVVWQNKNMRNHANNSMLVGDYLYGMDGDVDVGTLRCVDFKTGESRWSKDDIKAGALMVADGKLIIMSSKGDLILAEASPEAYKELGRVHVLDGRCWTMPVLSGGLIYCRSHQGDLVCVDVRKKP